MRKIKVHVLVAGGLGDAILSSRFIPAIRERHGKDCEIVGYFNTDGATFQKEGVEAIYPTFFDKIVILAASDKKSPTYTMTNHVFGITENFSAHINNLNDEIRSEFLSCDKWYDLHIDFLQWIEDPEFRARLSFMPKAEPTQIDSGESHVIFQPYSRIGGRHNLADFYVKRLVAHFAEKSIKVKIIVSDENKSLVEKEVVELPNVELINAPIEEVCRLIGDKSCRCLIGIDSSLRLIAHAYRTPTLVFSADCIAPFQVSPSHYLRWLPFEKSVLPLNFNLNHTLGAIDAILENPAAALFPIKDFAKYANLKYIGNE